MAAALARRSPLAMVLLVLLAEAPMHPYRMRELIRERDKDSVVNVASRNSVYQALSRLERAGLVAARETTRAQRRPERTVYAITDAGWTQLQEWLRAMLAQPRNEYPEFPAALASLPVFGPAEVAGLLQTRVDALREQLSGPDPATIAAEHHLHRVFVVEEEYKRAMAEAEVAWLSALLDDLRSGALTWEAPG